MGKEFIDKVVGKIIEYESFWCSENMFVYEEEEVYIVFDKKDDYYLDENEQKTYAYLIDNLEMVVNKSLQTVKDIFSDEKLDVTRFNCIFIGSDNTFKVFGYFQEEEFDFSIQFDIMNNSVKFEVE